MGEPAPRGEVAAMVAVQSALADRPGVLATARGMSHFGEHSVGWLIVELVGALLIERRRREWLVAAGGTTILTETPEIYGAEHLLMRRARSRAVGEKLAARIRWWEHYAGMFGVKLDNNPSVGNKEGGLTTIYEKSLGAVAKAGTTALNGVYLYGEPITERGFVFMDSPGFDPTSVTGLVASGANVVAFTTGRGSCFGCKPVPSIKIATNTPMYERMLDDMDVDAGVILGGTSVAEVGRQIFDLMLEVASGRKTKSELHGVGDEEFSPWSIGPTL